jgi:flagellar protein FlaC
MGKEGDQSEEEQNIDNQEKPEETPKNVEEENSEENKTDEKKEEKTDVEELRKVIKVDENKEEKKEEKQPEEAADLDSETREGLEQKRAILQNIKDFDFQIKKNQEEITAVNKKLDAVSKDLDDLVSLYEIVSEQMNPFVGLSKVTKKRLDALENFTREIDDLKNRMGDIESFAERAGADLNVIRETRVVKPEEKSEENESEEEILESESENDLEPEINTVEESEKPVETTEISNLDNISTGFTSSNLNDDYIDIILEKSLRSMALDLKFDRVLDEFIESLKA